MNVDDQVALLEKLQGELANAGYVTELVPDTGHSTVRLAVWMPSAPERRALIAVTDDVGVAEYRCSFGGERATVGTPVGALCFLESRFYGG